MFNIFKIKNYIKVSLVLLATACTYLFSQFFLIPKDLYYIIPWLDIPMHIWGGFLFAVLYAFIYKAFISADVSHVKWLEILIFVLLIGIVWEVYEYVHDVMHSVAWGGYSDSLKDLVNDALGAALAYYVFVKKDRGML